MEVHGDETASTELIEPRQTAGVATESPDIAANDSFYGETRIAA